MLVASRGKWSLSWTLSLLLTVLVLLHSPQPNRFVEANDPYPRNNNYNFNSVNNNNYDANLRNFPQELGNSNSRAYITRQTTLQLRGNTLPFSSNNNNLNNFGQVNNNLNNYRLNNNLNHYGQVNNNNLHYYNPNNYNLNNVNNYLDNFNNNNYNNNNFNNNNNNIFNQGQSPERYSANLRFFEEQRAKSNQNPISDTSSPPAGSSVKSFPPPQVNESLPLSPEGALEQEAWEHDNQPELHLRPYAYDYIPQGWDRCLPIKCFNRCDLQKKPGVVCCTDVLYDMALGVSRFFEEHKLPYMIMFGTLLGAYRDKDIIPWTADVDFAVPLWTMQLMLRDKNMHRKLEKRGYTFFFDLQDDAGVSRICVNKHHPTFGNMTREVVHNKRAFPTYGGFYRSRFPYADVYSTQVIKNDLRTNGQTFYFPLSWAFPTTQCTIRNETFACPSQHYAVLYKYFKGKLSPSQVNGSDRKTWMNY